VSASLPACVPAGLQNEKSGALLPSLDGSRRLRDPRAMRNDYGRLPYHLAIRKGLTWLGEMLDPSVPVRWGRGAGAPTMHACCPSTLQMFSVYGTAALQLWLWALHRLCVWTFG
jgi:hypothetical protein